MSGSCAQGDFGKDPFQMKSVVLIPYPLQIVETEKDLMEAMDCFCRTEEKGGPL